MARIATQLFGWISYDELSAMDCMREAAKAGFKLIEGWTTFFETDEASPIAIDCIEFDPLLRRIDCAAEVAFFAMDLLYRGRADLAERFLAQYAALRDDFQLYGVIGVAIGVLVPGLWLVKRRGKTLSGEGFTVKPKPLNRGTVIGSVLFGLGWSLTGICPGPAFVSIGEGKLYALVMLAGVLAGTTLLGVAHPKLSTLLRLTPTKAPEPEGP